MKIWQIRKSPWAFPTSSWSVLLHIFPLVDHWSSNYRFNENIVIFFNKMEPLSLNLTGNALECKFLLTISPLPCLIDTLEYSFLTLLGPGSEKALKVLGGGGDSLPPHPPLPISKSKHRRIIKMVSTESYSHEEHKLKKFWNRVKNDVTVTHYVISEKCITGKGCAGASTVSR